MQHGPCAGARGTGLVARANRGDLAAFAALHRATRDWVVGGARRLTGSSDDALDVLQEIFVWWFGRFPGFRLTSSLPSFLYPWLSTRRSRCCALDVFGPPFTDVHPRSIPYLLVGKSVVITGRVRGPLASHVVVRGRAGGQPVA